MESSMSEKFEWTDENIKILKDMLNAGASARDIAEKLGNTRNAVIGKANRLKLSTPKSDKEKTVKEKKSTAITYPDDNLCQWPTGHPNEEGFHFCGKPVQGSLPYCEAHCNSAYRRSTAQTTA